MTERSVVIVQYIVNPDSTISTLLADVNSHAAKISGKLAVARRTLVKRATFNGCTPSQETLLVSAASAAQNYASDTLSYARSHASTPRYTTWFGAYTTARYSTVVSHFSNISNNAFSSYAFDCSTCTEPDTYAYVYPDKYVFHSRLPFTTLTVSSSLVLESFTCVRHSGRRQ